MQVAHRDCLRLGNGAHFRSCQKTLAKVGGKVFYGAPTEFHAIMDQYQQLIDVSLKIRYYANKPTLDFSVAEDRQELRDRQWAKVPSLQQYVIRLQTEHCDKYQEVFGRSGDVEN